MKDTATPMVHVEFWATNAEDGVRAQVEVERDEYDGTRIAIHTFVNDRGSVSSYYLDREATISLALDLLRAVDLR